MASTLPPPPPNQPPGGPEYLDSGAGAPLPPARTGRGLKRGLLVGGTVVGLGAVGVAAWAAYGFFSTGAQPAEALPAGTLGYVSIDLDPSGGQKIEALRTLDKFPAFKDKVGITGDSDLRKTIFEKLQAGSQCTGLDYDSDIEPWLGDRAAVAAVDTGGDTPMPVLVVQVKDADKAAAGLTRLKDCGGGGDTVGWAFEGDWAVVTQSTDEAEKVIAETEKGSLADDTDFKKWTGETGDAGVMTMYAGPAAGDYLADHAEELLGNADAFGALSGLGGPPSRNYSGDDSSYGWSATVPSAYTPDAMTAADDSGVPEALKKQLEAFQGMAATVRFDDGAIELESAGDAAVGKQLFGAGGTADVVGSLPEDTVAAFGLGFSDGWFSDVIDYASSVTGQSSTDLMQQLSQATGLDLPQDAETLAGDSAALAIGPGFDPEEVFTSGDVSSLPVGVKIKGDPDAIQSVLDKLISQTGDDGTILGTDSGDGALAIGPSSDYRAQLLQDGTLGDSDVYQDVVRDSDKASSVLFVDVDEIQSMIGDLGGSDNKELLANLDPIAGFGVSSWVDGDTAHGVVRLTTDK